MTIISRRESPAGRNFRMMTLRSALPSRSRSSEVRGISSFSRMVGIWSFLKFMTASKILKMGSRTNWRRKKKGGGVRTGAGRRRKKRNAGVPC